MRTPLPSLTCLTVLLVACGADNKPDGDDSLDEPAAQTNADAGPLVDAGSLDASRVGRADASDGGELDAAAPGPEADASAALDASVATSCNERAGAVTADVTAIVATAKGGGAPSKGEALQLTLRVVNSGPGVARVKLTPLLESKRFSDYIGVPLATREVTLCPGNNSVAIEGGPFLDNPINGKQYALGSGEYIVSGVRIEPAGQPSSSDNKYEGASFRVLTSNALLVPVVHDARYFEQVQGLTTKTPEAYLTQMVTRPGELFTPSNNNDPDGAGNFQKFPGGFDEMMKVRHLFKTFAGFPGEKTTKEGWCEDAAAYGKSVLKLAADWNTQSAETRPERHGFDYLIALSPDMGGGVACGWLDVQVSSLINRDLDRQQIVAVHESGHLFGAPHCDDVGNGAGGSLQGYVMCSGEKNAQYPASFVWHATSRTKMSSHWD